MNATFMKVLDDLNKHNLSSRTIEENEKLAKDYRIIEKDNIWFLNKSVDKVRKKVMNRRNRKKKITQNFDTKRLLNETTDSLQRLKFEVSTLFDDGKTSKTIHRQTKYDFYLLPNRTVYYKIDLSEFKDKVYLSIEYIDALKLGITNSKLYDLNVFVSK